ncbi:MAG: molybdopterin guanine dinucleotide-containing S/N-oxide reductase [Hyphomicrobiales bacterium]|nr:molybdopterin guanine dinucleotide-containing S/N-oxide reductase [Hyphomicrobiales bacterium]
MNQRWVRTASHWGAFWVEVRDGRVVGTRPFEHDTHPSPLVASQVAAVYDKSRVDRPYVRKGFLERGAGGTADDRQRRGVEPFVAVDWETAVGLVAGELSRVKDAFGNRAIFAGSYGWSSAGRLHHAKSLLQRFMNLIGGATVQVDTYSNAAASVIAPHVLGDSRAIGGPTTTFDSIAAHTRLVVSFGGMPLKNLQIDAGGTGEHSSQASILALAGRGIQFVCISPLRTDLPAELKAEWLPAAPGTDTAIMLGLAHTLVAEGLHDAAFLNRYTVGFDRFRRYLMGDDDGEPKDAEWAARISGLDSVTIRALARRMAATRTFITTTWSLQRADHGEQPIWMTVVLAAILGQIGLPGGGFGFGYGSMNRMGQARSLVAPLNRPVGRSPLKSFIPVARISDLLLGPGETIDYNGQRITFPDIRLVYWCGGNPFHHHQDINRLVEAWRRPETVIVHEIFWTPTARHADIVLPATTTLERNDIAASADRYMFAMHQAIAPVAGARNDFDIFADLAQHFGMRDAFTEGRSEMEWLRHLYEVVRQQAARHGIERPDFETFWELGYVADPVPREFDYLAGFRADPDGNRLRTPSGRIEIFSERIASFGYDDCPGHPVWIAPAEWLGAPKADRFKLHLISNQPTLRLHGQLDNGPVSRQAKINGREPVLINPADAAARSIADGDAVRIFNDRGACLAGAMLTDAVGRGVLQLQTGAWYDPDEPGLVGALDRHGNPNVLTLDKGTSKLAQGPSSQTTLVEVERFNAPLPAVGAFDPPAIVTG